MKFIKSEIRALLVWDSLRLGHKKTSDFFFLLYHMCLEVSSSVMSHSSEILQDLFFWNRLRLNFFEPIRVTKNKTISIKNLCFSIDVQESPLSYLVFILKILKTTQPIVYFFLYWPYSYTKCCEAYILLGLNFCRDMRKHFLL